MYKYQFGFRQNHSTTQALIEIADNLKESIDKKMTTCGIFLDLTKAFDTVDHKILMKNYSIMGLGEQLINFLKAILPTVFNL